MPSNPSIDIKRLAAAIREIHEAVNAGIVDNTDPIGDLASAVAEMLKDHLRLTRDSTEWLEGALLCELLPDEDDDDAPVR